jgi:hypothetical protein
MVDKQAGQERWRPSCPSGGNAARKLKPETQTQRQLSLLVVYRQVTRGTRDSEECCCFVMAGKAQVGLQIAGAHQVTFAGKSVQGKGTGQESAVK